MILISGLAQPIQNSYILESFDIITTCSSILLYTSEECLYLGITKSEFTCSVYFKELSKHSDLEFEKFINNLVQFLLLAFGIPVIQENKKDLRASD